MSNDPRDDVRHMAAASGDGLTWFDRLYVEAGGDASRIPWADLKPNPHLIAWLDREQPRGRGSRAIVVGCGLGDDAELLSRWGFAVTAFDLSPAAIDWCRDRFPSTRVEYLTADLLNLPQRWPRAWDFVFEAYTLQALPGTIRPAATAAVASFLKPGGRLLLIARGREDDDPADGPPWPLTRAEIGALTADGSLRLDGFEDLIDADPPHTRRFRASFACDAI